MLNKVLKRMKADEKKSVNKGSMSKGYTGKVLPSNAGFHAKQNSQAGAERQRSMGNRNTKPAR